MPDKKIIPTTKYKIWIEIERIDTNEEGEEEYSDCDFPESVGYCKTYEEAEKLQKEIIKIFGEQ